MAGLKVLLVEDDWPWQTILSESLRATLRSFGEADEALTIAPTLKAGLEALSGALRWDLVVTDIGFPPTLKDKLGNALIERAHSLKIPTIVVSGHASQDEVRDYLVRDGVRDFFAKVGFHSRSDAFGRAVTAILKGATTASAPASAPLIKILFLAANPIDTSGLRLGEEVRTIEERLRAAQFRERFELFQQHALRVTDLSEALLRHQPHIVHFSGHGSASGQIVLESATGNAEYMDSGAIARLFRILRDNVRCVVLNACHSSGQAKDIAKHIECVIGTARAIGDAAAISFAGGFYRAIGYGRSVQVAFDLGCNEIGLSSQLGEESTPQLLGREGVDPGSVYLGGAPSAPGMR